MFLPDTTTLVLPIWLDLSSVIVGSLCGALIARAHKLDLFGVTSMALIVGLGGGCIRDMIMQVGSVYMLESPFAIPLAIATGLFVFFFHRPFEKIPGVIDWVDILAVAIFATAGCDKALIHNLNPLACILMGAITGIGGGMIRDVLLREIPAVFQRGNLYAFCALAGSSSYFVLAGPADMNKYLAAGISVLITTSLRRWSLRYNVMSPADVDLSPKLIEPMKRLSARGKIKSAQFMKHMVKTYRARKKPHDQGL